jgi:hypothetical protein
MKMKLSTTLALSALALGLAASPSMAQTPAPAAPAHVKHHAAGHAAKKGTPASDSMADQLNAQSLAASQSGQAFMPPGGPATPAAAPAPKKKM